MIDPRNPYKGRARPKFSASKGGDQLLRKQVRSRVTGAATKARCLVATMIFLTGGCVDGFFNSNFDRSSRKR